MRVQITKGPPGWCELQIGMTPTDLDALITALQELRVDPNQHFHLMNTFDEEAGVSDIEFNIIDGGQSDNMVISGPMVPPNR